MSPPVATASAAIATSNPTASTMGPGSFSSFNDLDLDQFILKDTNNNELMPHMLNVNDTDNGLNGFKGFLSTSPESCSSILNNNLLNSNEFDLFKFDKLAGNEMFDFSYSNYSTVPSTTNTNGTYNFNPNSNNIHSHDSEEIESDEDHIVQSLLQEQELDPEAFELALSDDNEHMINDFEMISVANSQADIITHHQNQNHHHHLNNDDRLVAIRDMKRQHPRKHKNSTSSISSVSTSIKKVAIELQNSCTANLVSGSESAGQANHHNQHMTNNMLDHASNLTSGSLDDFDDDNDFDDLLGLDDWEQMLDEDYISRFTTDFGSNYTANVTPNNTNEAMTGMNQKTAVTPLASHIQTVKLPVSSNYSNKEISQSPRLVPHISTMSTSKSNNHPLVLVLSNSSSSSSIASSSSAASSTTPSSSIYQNKLKTNSSPSLTPIASPMCNHVKKITTTSITPTKIISTSKSATTPISNSVVKKLNSVIINDSTRSENNSSPFGKNTTIKLENGNSNIENNPNHNTTANQLNGYSNIILKNKTNTAANHITNTTNKTITRQIPLTPTNSINQQSGIKSYRVNQPFNVQTNNSTNLSMNGGSSVNCSSASSAASSPNLSPNASASPSSSIDYPEIIDCVNPNQIFPYRLPLLRFVKTDSAAENGMKREIENDWRGNKYYSTSQAYEDEEDEEEIDVVSVHNNNTGSNSSNNLNMNYHHNYFHTPGSGTSGAGSSLSGNSTASSSTSTSKKQGSKKNSKNSEDINKSLSKSSNAGRKANSSGLKKSNLNRQLAGNNSAASSINSNSNMAQLNSIRILTTTPTSGSSTSNANNLRQISTTSISKTPQTSSIKLNNSTPSSMILNKDSAASPITTTTKYITMTSSKLQTNNNIKCQTITPTINSNKPKIVTATNSNVLSLSANSLNNGNGSLNSGLKFNTFTTNSQNGGTTSSYITTLKIPTSLSKMGKKLTNKTQIKEENNGFGGSSFMKASLNGNNSNSVLLTEDDEFYYEDEEFNRGLAMGCSMLEKSSTAFIKNEVNLNTNLNSTSNIQLSSVKFNDDETLYGDCINGDLSDDMDDIDDDDIDDEDDDECSTSSSTASPSPLTSSSSGFSTPTKGSKLKAELSDINDISTFSEKLSKKPKKSMNSSLSSSLSSNNLNSTSSKRNSRLTSMGYSSDNPAEKRAFHILSERQRRNDLKKLFETLRTNIPTLCDKQKASKLTILKAAVDHLCEVSNKKEKLSSIYEKEKARHAQLIQHLKSLQNQQQNQSQHLGFNYQTVQTSNQSALAVH